MKHLEQKVAVITGGSAGIGLAIGHEMARLGARVVLIARGQDGLDSAVSDIRSGGGEAYAFAADLCSAAAIRTTLDAIEKLVGPIDILINNVGAGTFKPLHETTNAECDLAIQLPYGAAMVATHYVVKGMVARQSGHIVNLTSPAGIFPLPFMVPYTAARHAMVGLSHALYEELKGSGVGVSLVCPAQVNTDYFRHNDADMSWYPKISTLFPVLQPEDVARAVVDAILHEKREVILPPLLKAFVSAFRKTPRMSVHVLSALGLWRPSKVMGATTVGGER